MELRTWIRRGALVTILGLASLARAQATDIDDLHGDQAFAGGGVVDFTGNAAAHLTTVGGLWDVRIGFYGDQILGFECAYTGTANQVNNVMTAFAPGVTIIGTSLEGDFRLQVPRWVSEQSLAHLQPYAFVGAGWNNYSLTGGRVTDPAALKNSDNSVLLPWGGGAQVYITQHFTMDGRFTYRALFDDDMLHTSAQGVPGVPAQSMSQWAVSARVGYAF